ncbi:MAG: hypothetical protein EP330_25165 [Deltaproteobacteria bacterium]|nr:MAG: hypothetical protein EP330_25165 [Deltaproteobacteria bacterium]
MFRAVVCCLALLATQVASAAPLFHVSDYAVHRAGADIRVLDERAEVVAARASLARSKDARADLREDRKAARFVCRSATRNLRKAEHRFRANRRSDHVLAASDARAQIHDLARNLAEAEDHEAWHDSEMTASRARIRRDRAAVRVAIAQRELAEAHAMAATGPRLTPMLPVAAYEGQLNRAGDRAAMRSAELSVARIRTQDDHGDYLATR